MSTSHEAPDWREYKMDYRHPHKELEPLEREIEARRIEVEAEAAASLSNPSGADAASKCLSDFMNEITSEALARADELTHTLASAS